MVKRCPRPFDGVPRLLIKLIEVLTILFHNYFAGYFDYWTLNRGGPLNCWPLNEVSTELSSSIIRTIYNILHILWVYFTRTEPLSVLFPLDQTNVSETTGSKSRENRNTLLDRNKISNLTAAFHY